MDKRNKILRNISIGSIALFLVANLLFIGMGSSWIGDGESTSPLMLLFGGLTFLSPWIVLVVGLITQNMYVVESEKDRKTKKVLLFGAIAVWVINFTILGGLWSL